MPEVRGPDGVITRFPEGTPDAKINEVMATIYSAKPAAASKPKDTSAANGFALGLIKPIDNLSRLVAAGQQAIGMDTTVPDANYARNQADRANNTRTGYQLAGNIVGTLPTAAVPGGVLAQGAVGGAALSDADTAGGVLLDTAIGAGASAAGNAVVKGVAGAIAPKVAPYIDKLTAAGVPVTPGQLARAAGTKVGNFVAGVEDKATSLPFVGGMIADARAGGVDKLNRAFTERVLKPIGAALPDNIPTGHDAVAFAQDAVRAAYQAVIPQTRGTVDNTFLKRTVATKARANLPDAQAAQLDDVVQREVGQMFDAAGNFAGKRTTQVLDRLDKLAADFRKSQNTYERDLGSAIGDIRRHVIDLVRRNNPQAGKQLQAANTAHANLVRLENATANTAEGIASPLQFRQAVVRSDRTIRKKGSAGGRALGQDLAKAGAAVLPSKIGDSGTFTRASAANLPALMLGGVAAPIYAGARAVAPLMTRQAGPRANYVANLVRQGAAPVSLAAPALLRRPE